jgi:hypothetical protein
VDSRGGGVIWGVGVGVGGLEDDLGGELVGDLGGDLGQFKNPFLKNHALAQSLLSRVFSWDVVNVGFPTCLRGKVS